jgi:4-hydroxy-3-polyprenylbenzoate decarboxylase
MPACPSFYSRPQTMDALVDTVVARVLDRLGIPNELMRRWEGLAPGAGAEPKEE